MYCQLVTAGPASIRLHPVASGISERKAQREQARSIVREGREASNLVALVLFSLGVSSRLFVLSPLQIREITRVSPGAGVPARVEGSSEGFADAEKTHKRREKEREGEIGRDSYSLSQVTIGSLSSWGILIRELIHILCTAQAPKSHL